MLEWSSREPPLSPRGLAVSGTPARRLALRLSDEQASRALLTGLASGDTLVLLGPTACLPWIDGAMWVGPDPDMPDLWTRTFLRPTVPADLVMHALESRVRAPRPWLLLSGGLVIPLGAAGPLDPAALTGWASR